MTNHPTVLLIEDDDSVRQALGRLLDAAGFHTAAYASAEALLAVNVDQLAQCVVSDLRLPGMSGLDLLAELRKRGARSPLILITGYDAPGLRQEAARRGAAAFLVKPFRGALLLDAIKAAIGSAKP